MAACWSSFFLYVVLQQTALMFPGWIPTLKCLQHVSPPGQGQRLSWEHGSALTQELAEEPVVLLKWWMRLCLMVSLCRVHGRRWARETAESPLLLTHCGRSARSPIVTATVRVFLNVFNSHLLNPTSRKHVHYTWIWCSLRYRVACFYSFIRGFEQLTVWPCTVSPWCHKYSNHCCHCWVKPRSIWVLNHIRLDSLTLSSILKWKLNYISDWSMGTFT